MLIQSAKPYFPSEDIEKIVYEMKSVLENGMLLGIEGKNNLRFERLFSEYTGVKYSVGTNSGTSSLEIALRCLGVKDGSEVIVPTNTFLGSPNSVIFAGGKPVFADINPKNLCIDVEDVQKKITKKTVGIMLVHIAGLISPQIEDLVELCEEKALFLLEDAAHAHGAIYKGKMAGSLGDAGCFSFFPTKIVTCGEGGIICTNNVRLTKKAKVLRYDGIGSEGLHIEIGNNWHPSEIHAILGIQQLLRLEEFVLKRNDIAKKYDRKLERLQEVSSFEVPTCTRHSYYKYPVLLDSDIDSDLLMWKMKEKFGVETGRVYYPPCHLQPVYIREFGYSKGSFPVAEEILKRVICLPMFVQMREKEIQYVVESLERAIRN
jgi:dTDP-4-amino-4,6-dideoxygalactose transaminase